MASGASGEPRERGSPRKGFLLRLPPALLEELRGWASQDLRSLNAQIEFVLRDALERRKGRRGREASETPKPPRPESGGESPSERAGEPPSEPGASRHEPEGDPPSRPE